MEALVGNTLDRILADKGYRGHNAPPDHKFRIFISGQKRGVTPKIKRQLRRRSAVEPVMGHLKAEHRMGRNYLWYRRGDAANAVLAAVGYNCVACQAPPTIINWFGRLFHFRKTGAAPKVARRRELTADTALSPADFPPIPCRGSGRYRTSPGSFGYRRKTRLLEGRDVDKHVLAATALGLDETVTLSRIEPLRCSPWHSADPR
jgi:hypothetical protein